MPPAPRERPTSRVVLLDRDGRILLMRGRLPGGKYAAAWFTVGGGVEAGETYLEAAAREIREETGIGAFELGPVLWVRRGVLNLPDPTLMLEQYVLARCDAVEPTRDGWDALERELIEDIRWWTLAELMTTEDPVFPPGLARLLGDVLAGPLPTEPIPIPWD